MAGCRLVHHIFYVPSSMTTELKYRGRKMNIKISKKRAARILQEEVEKFLKENLDVDPKELKEFLENQITGDAK